MSRVIEYIKSTLLVGLLVIVPITILVVVLSQIYVGLHDLAAGFVDSLPVDLKNEALFVAIVSVLGVAAVCFVTGLLIQTRLGVALKAWFNRNVGRRIPMYNAFASLTRRFVGVKGKAFAPVEVDLYGSDTRALGFLIEKLPDGRCTIFIPSSPVATVGNIVIVPSNSVRPLDTTTAEAVTVLSQWGVDSHKLYVSEKQVIED